MIGQTISRYRLDEKLGEGGVGVVYRAFDLRLGRMVALKMLRPDLASNTSLSRSLANEARAASSLNHPGIATLFDFEATEGFTFLVYEYIKGKTLREVEQERLLNLDQMLGLFVNMAEGVAAAHEAGIVHRDLKPENVMLMDNGRTKVLDFGLARVTNSMDNSMISTAITTPGMLIGTVAYMSPEQLEGDPVDHRTDIFAIGTMLYEAVTGIHPFKGRSPSSTIGNILKEEPQNLPVATLPADLDRVVRKCVRKKKEERYQSLRDFIVDIEAIRRGDRDPSIRRAHNGRPLPEVEFSLSGSTARGLFLLAQCGYLALYGTAIFYADAIGAMLPGLWTFTALIVSAMCGIAVRLYLLSSVGFRHPAAPRQFRRLFPAILFLDGLWAASPLLLWQRIGYVSLGCVAIMTYLPFSQRTLMYSAYPSTRDSVITLRRE